MTQVDLGSIKGPKGDSAYWSFDIDDNGELIATYEEVEGSTPPNLSIDDEGNMIQNINGSTMNLGKVVGSDGPQGPAGENGKDGEPGEGVPEGGTTGQVLSKKSDTDYDTEWVDASDGDDLWFGTCRLLNEAWYSYDSYDPSVVNFRFEIEYLGKDQETPTYEFEIFDCLEKKQSNGNVLVGPNSTEGFWNRAYGKLNLGLNSEQSATFELSVNSDSEHLNYPQLVQAKFFDESMNTIAVNNFLIPSFNSLSSSTEETEESTPTGPTNVRYRGFSEYDISTASGGVNLKISLDDAPYNTWIDSMTYNYEENYSTYQGVYGKIFLGYGTSNNSLKVALTNKGWNDNTYGTIWLYLYNQSSSNGTQIPIYLEDGSKCTKLSQLAEIGDNIELEIIGQYSNMYGSKAIAHKSYM